MEFTFEQNQAIDSLEGVPEDFRAFYAQDEDKKFVIGDSFKKATAAIDGLNKTAKTLRGGERDLKAAIAGFKALGDTPEQVKEKIDELNAALSSKEKINPEKIKEEITKSFEGKLKERDDKLSAKDKAIHKYLVTSQATTAIAEAKGVPDLLLPHIERQVKVVEDNGDYKVTVVDAQGETRYGATGSPLTIAELVTNMKTDKIFGRAFESEGGSGGGAGTKQSGQRVTSPNNTAPKSSIDKITAGLAKRAGN